MTRDERLAQLRTDCTGHPGTMQIMGIDIDMDSIEEVRLALLWVSWQSSQVIRALQKAQP